MIMVSRTRPHDAGCLSHTVASVEYTYTLLRPLKLSFDIVCICQCFSVARCFERPIFVMEIEGLSELQS